MKFASFIYNGEEKIGAVKENRVYVLENILQNPPKNMLELIDVYSGDVVAEINESIGEDEGINLGDIKLIAPIPEPKRGVICLGKNYLEHVNEVDTVLISGKDGIPQAPIYFYKLVDRAVGHMEEIHSNAEVTSQLDYEVELGVIIGKEGKNIPLERVEEYIFGYTIINDISAREIQKKHVQWLRGKSLDGTCPMGPYIVTKDEIEFPPKLKIESYVNGEKRQSGNTTQMIYGISRVISEFSRGTTLKSGDIISTGTPAGVGMGFTPPKYLKSGDLVECRIDGIGVLKNKVK